MHRIDKWWCFNRPPRLLSLSLRLGVESEWTFQGSLFSLFFGSPEIQGSIHSHFSWNSITYCIYFFLTKSQRVTLTTAQQGADQCVFGHVHRMTKQPHCPLSAAQNLGIAIAENMAHQLQSSNSLAKVGACARELMCFILQETHYWINQWISRNHIPMWIGLNYVQQSFVFKPFCLCCFPWNSLSMPRAQNVRKLNLDFISIGPVLHLCSEFFRPHSGNDVIADRLSQRDVLRLQRGGWTLDTEMRCVRKVGQGIASA